MNKILSIALLACLLGATGCSVQSSLSTISAITSEADAVVASIAADTTIDPVVLAQLKTALDTVVAANQAALAVVKSGETGKQELADIATAYANAVIPDLPLSANTKVLIAILNAAIKGFVAYLQAQEAAAPAVVSHSRFHLHVLSADSFKARSLSSANASLHKKILALK